MTPLYSKKYIRRPGTSDEGRDFENLIISNLALNFALDKTISNFDIKSNVDDYGAFDDVIFQVEKNESRKLYCMQLKYKHDKKRTLSKKALNEKSGNYSLRMYCADYHSIIAKTNLSFTGILWTRAQFTADKNEVLSNGFCKYRIKQADHFDETTKLCRSLDKNCVCYRFVVEGKTDSFKPYHQFFDNFILCVTNTSNYTIQKNIDDIFNANFFQNSASVSFIELVKNCNKHCIHLGKKLIRSGISLCLLDAHMVSLTFETELTQPKKLLIQAILHNTVTHLTTIKNFTDFGRDTRKQMQESEVKKLANLFKFANNDAQKVCNKALWLQELCPLAVNSNDTVRAAIQFNPSLKYILIHKTAKTIDSVKNFKNLEDLKHQASILYQNFLETLKCQLQNKAINLKTLVDLDVKVPEMITANELIAMAHDKLNISRVVLELPNPHITPRHFKVNHNGGKNSLIEDTEITTDETKIVILSGKPGMGKTTLSKHFVYSSKPSLWTLFLNARDLAVFLSDKKDNLEEFKRYLLETQKQQLNHFDFQIFRVFFESYAIRFLWDALDEVNESNFKSIKSLIKQLQNEKTRHYITARLHLTSDLEQTFQHINYQSLTLTEFDEAEQRYYIQQKLDLSEENLEKTFSIIKSNILSINYFDILGIPLQIYMITELLKQKRVSIDNINNQQFTLDTLYEYFIEEKLKVYFIEKLKFDPSVKGVMRIIIKEISDYTNLFQRLAIQLYFNQNGFDVKCDLEMLEDIKRNGDLTGFIIRLDETSEYYAKAQFFHSSISEFFAAQYLAENLGAMKNIEDCYFDLKCGNIRFFLDLLLARNCRPHIAVLQKNLTLLDQCSEAEIRQNDKGNRNPLQLLVLTNKQMLNKKPYEVKNSTIILNTWVQKVFEFRTHEIKEIINRIKVLVHQVDIFARDTLFNFDIFDSAIKTNFFLVLGIIYVELKTLPNRLFEQYQNDIIVSCLLHDYSDILDVLDKLPNIVTFIPYFDVKYSFECTLLYYKCSNWIQKLTLDKSLKCKTTFNFLKLTEGENWSFIYKSFTCNNFFTFAKEIHQIVDLITKITKSSVINRKNKKGQTLFSIACKLALSETVNLLLENGADLKITDNKKLTPLHHACFCANSQPNATTKCVCEPYRIFTVKTLLEKRRSLVNARSLKKATPLQYLCCNSVNLDVFKVLLENNADINATDDAKCTVLHFACQYRYATTEMIEFILENRVFVNCEDVEGNTPLHLAALHCYQNVIECLIGNGADVNSVNKMALTPLDNAYKAGDKDKIELLLKHDAKRKSILRF